MIKMSVFNKTNDVLIVITFKNVFQRRNIYVNMIVWSSSMNYITEQ